MLLQYLRASLRNLIKHRLHSVLNILGLSIGLAACLVIFAYVQYEFSYDKHHPDSENVYRIALNRIYPTQSKKWAITAPVVAPTLTEQLPEVEHYTRLIWDDVMLAPSTEKMEIQRLTAVDSGFFKVFSAQVISGSISNDFFKRDNGLILTETAAKKYFKDEDAVGQLFVANIMNQNSSFIVEAVIEDPKPNSHFSYEVLCGIRAIGLPNFLLKSWGTWATYSYLRVTDNTDPALLTQRINKISEENQGAGDPDYQAWLDAGNYYEYFLQPINDIHLESHLSQEFEANSNRNFVYFFTIVGVFILLMAVVNFVNLATARASYRTKEVGIRKTIGANRKDLIFQFLLESTLISFIALAIALPLTQFFLPFFNQIISKSITLAAFSSPLAISILILTPIILGVLSGFYPALYLSHFGPSSVFNRLVSTHGKQKLRHVLVVFQFAIAVILIAGTSTVYRQMHFMTNTPLGFDKEQLIKIDRIPFSGEKADIFVNKVLSVPGVANISMSSWPLDDIRDGRAVRTSENDQDWVNMSFLNVDERYVNTLGIKLIAGKSFFQNSTQKENASAHKVILNETAARSLGWTPGEAINNSLIFNDINNATVVGVVEDFHYGSLEEPIYPLIFSDGPFPDLISSASIRLDPRKMQETLSEIDAIWGQLVPDQVFDFEYMDEAMAQYYEAEKLTGKLFILFSGLAIFISCLGLFGLMGYVVERRAKEVGVRKVLGAKISHIILLLSKDYIRLIVFSTVIAVPVAWLGLEEWLSNFAYRVNNSLWFLLFAGSMVTLISWITVAYYAFQSAKANPVKSLRSE